MRYDDEWISVKLRVNKAQSCPSGLCWLFLPASSRHESGPPEAALNYSFLTNLGSSLIWTECFPLLCICVLLWYSQFISYEFDIKLSVSVLFPTSNSKIPGIGWGPWQHSLPMLFVPERVSFYKMSQKLTRFFDKEEFPSSCGHLQLATVHRKVKYSKWVFCNFL